jgi:hypothetical protein
MAANDKSPSKGHDGVESNAEQLSKEQREYVLSLAQEHGIEGPVPIYSIAADVLAHSESGVIEKDEFLSRCHIWADYSKRPEQFVEIVVGVPPELEAAVEEQLHLEGRAGDERRREELLLDRVQIEFE